MLAVVAAGCCFLRWLFFSVFVIVAAVVCCYCILFQLVDVAIFACDAVTFFLFS